MEDGAVDHAEFAKAVGSGRQFADRVRLERIQRGWSQAELSRRMRAIGQPLDQAAISKIESAPEGDRARRIDIDEAIGFARVFGLSLEQMTIPIADPTELSALRLLANSARYSREYREVQASYNEAVRLVAVAVALLPGVATQFDRRKIEASASVFGLERQFLEDVDLQIARYRKSGRSLAHAAFGVADELDDDTVKAVLLKFLRNFEWPNGEGIGPIDFRGADG